MGAVAGRAVPMVGRGLVALSIGMSVYNVATSDNKTQALSHEAGGWAGAYAGGEAGAYTGAAIGSLFGGVGAVPGAVIGGIIGSGAGYIFGSELGDRAYQNW